MGEVYRARDTKLNRDVALKILPETFALDGDRIARFRREAQVLASLNHPNIAAIYGFEDSGTTHALVLELVDGPTLADRIAKGPMSLDEALPIARQIADALGTAHEQGIIHRDLKPANIKIRGDGTVKVLDFGLAKALEPASAISPMMSAAPTITTPAQMTGVGMILGTAAYMSPEQAKGRPADKRSDIWAFGCVLYEMLTGTRAFPGDDIAETLAAVIKTEADTSRTPREVRPLLRACLTKSPKERLQSIGDAWLLLDAQDQGRSNASGSRPLGWIVATAVFAILTIVVTLLWIASTRTRPISRPLVRLDVRLAPDALPTATAAIAISPDGTRIVFPVRGQDGKQRLGTRSLDQESATTLPGTEEGTAPFFSPDGQWIGFFTPGALKKISLQGGTPVTLCEVLTPRGATWADDGTIIAGIRNTSGLVRVPDSGGMPGSLTELAPGDATHRWPQTLPGHDAVLYTASPDTISNEGASVRVLALKTGVSKTVIRDGYFGRYLPTDHAPGYLLFLRDQTLFAVPFDADRLETTGAPFPMIEGMARSATTGFGYFDLSQTGTIAYGRSRTADQSWPVVWLDSAGKTEPLIAAPKTYDEPRISPDGRRLAIQLRTGRTSDLYIHDLDRDTTLRLTFTGGGSPVWSPDGRHLAFAAASRDADSGDERFGIYWIRADGASQPEQLLRWKYQINPYSFSPDAKILTLFEATPDMGTNILMLPLDMSDTEHPKASKPEPFLKTPFNELEASFSPDGKWIAYRSNESGVMELYVRSFRGTGKWQLSSGGVMHPRWSPAGRQLFYETLDGHIMVLDYTVEADSFRASKPRLWTTERILAPSGAYNMDVAPDGKRLIGFPVPVADGETLNHMTFLFNFVDEIRRRAPAK